MAADVNEMPLMQAASALGGAQATLATKRNVLNIWEQMRKHERATQELKDLLPCPWDELDEATLCSPRPYEFFATFLMDYYVIQVGKKKGEPLKSDVALMYFKNALIQARQKFSRVVRPPLPSTPLHVSSSSPC